MKVGDLVKPGEGHGLRNESYRAIGIVLQLTPAREQGWSASVTVAWNDGDIEVEWPDYLETVNESR
jgi:hypothetical protein